MRIAILSDVHGNSVGLEAALADLQQHPADQIVCLGDMIQGGPQPAEVVARLRTMACPVVMGNADAWLLTGQATGAEPTTERQMAVREWQLTRLTPDDRAYIECAVALARHIEHVRANRATLRELTREKLCDAPTQAQEFAALLRQLWREHCETAR